MLASKRKTMQQERSPSRRLSRARHATMMQHAERPPRRMPSAEPQSRLANWPVQIKLVPVNAPYFDGAELLVAADCTAYRLWRFPSSASSGGHITLIGCPKLDGVDYTEKLTEIIRDNDVKSLTIVRMEVPCCGGLEYRRQDRTAK